MNSRPPVPQTGMLCFSSTSLFLEAPQSLYISRYIEPFARKVAESLALFGLQFGLQPILKRKRPQEASPEAVSLAPTNAWRGTAHAAVMLESYHQTRKTAVTQITTGRSMRPRLYSDLLLLALVPVLAGCATTSTTKPGEVQEAGPGTFKVGIAHTVRVGNDKEYEAVSLAGQYCHAKGQKLVIVPSHDNNVVTFRCESSSEPITSPSPTPPRSPTSLEPKPPP